jgi:hypothetical protein
MHFRGDANDKDFIKKVSENIMQSIRALALDSQKRVRQVRL